jgi:hypothetical protein
LPSPSPRNVEELLQHALEGRIEPGLVFDRITTFDGVPDGYWRWTNARPSKVMIGSEGSIEHHKV